MTPFSEKGDVLWDELQSECDWIVRAGAHGLVWPVNDSEFTRLAFPERIQGMRPVIEAVAGRIPVVIGVADPRPGAVALASEAGDAGADAVIALPPAGTTMADRELIADYYRQIADAAEVPVFIQNLSVPWGAGLTSEFIAELCREIPLVQYVKEERTLQRQCVSEIIALREPAIRAVFGGGTLLGLVDGHKRGAAGYMAASYVADIDAQIWDLMEAGDEAGARRVEAALAVLEKARQGTPARYVDRKEILVRRGVFSSNAARIGSCDLDQPFLAELEYGLSAVEPFFRL
jgi:4-hydroxy-tetrahydrodipicolinate synthase